MLSLVSPETESLASLSGAPSACPGVPAADVCGVRALIGIVGMPLERRPRPSSFAGEVRSFLTVPAARNLRLLVELVTLEGLPGPALGDGIPKPAPLFSTSGEPLHAPLLDPRSASPILDEVDRFILDCSLTATEDAVVVLSVSSSSDCEAVGGPGMSSHTLPPCPCPAPDLTEEPPGLPAADKARPNLGLAAPMGASAFARFAPAPSNPTRGDIRPLRPPLGDPTLASEAATVVLLLPSTSTRELGDFSLSLEGMRESSLKEGTSISRHPGPARSLGEFPLELSPPRPGDRLPGDWSRGLLEGELPTGEDADGCAAAAPLGDPSPPSSGALPIPGLPGGVPLALTNMHTRQGTPTGMHSQRAPGDPKHRQTNAVPGSSPDSHLAVRSQQSCQHYLFHSSPFCGLSAPPSLAPFSPRQLRLIRFSLAAARRSRAPPFHRLAAADLGELPDCLGPRLSACPGASSSMVEFSPSCVASSKGVLPSASWLGARACKSSADSGPGKLVVVTVRDCPNPWASSRDSTLAESSI